MKLRLLGNALRLRLSQSEVAKFRQAGRVGETMQFPGGTTLGWRLLADEGVSTLQARFENGEIQVLVPSAVATDWADSGQVGLYSPEGAAIAITIEKDFQCLHDPGTGRRDDADSFPNPAAASHS